MGMGQDQVPHAQQAGSCPSSPMDTFSPRPFLSRPGRPGEKESLLLWRGRPADCRVLGSVAGFLPVDARSTPVVTTKTQSPNTA